MNEPQIDRAAVEAMADSYKGSGSGVADMLLALLARVEAVERERDAADRFAQQVWETDDPYELVADNEMTVWDALVKAARPFAERADARSTAGEEG